MINISKFFIFLAIITACALPAHADLAQHSERKMNVDGIERTYQIHFPEPMPVNLKYGLPLVIVLHGGRSSGENIAKTSRFTAKSDKHGFIVVYPDGIGKIEGRRLSWNAGNCCDIAMEEKANDTAFIEGLIDYMVKFQGANPHHIYIAGLSNGGMMAYRLAGELSSKIAAVGVVSGGMFADQPAPKEPVSMMIIHGKRDQVIPLEGGAADNKIISSFVKEGASFLSAQNAFDYWRHTNGCQGQMKTETKGRIVSQIYNPCKNNSMTVLQVLENGAHNWPGSPKMVYSEFDDGSNYAGHDATEVLWNFFAQQRKNTIPTAP